MDTSAAPDAPETMKVLYLPGNPGAPAVLAAALLHALVRQCPFRQGNQQVALAAMLQFLAVNGWVMDPHPPAPLAAMVAEVAAGTLDVTNAAAWLASRLRPAGLAAAQVKEAPARQGLSVAERFKRATMKAQPKGMFQRFTDRARRAIYLAQEEAQLLRHDSVRPEHLLLGLVYEGQGVAATALESLGISLEDLRREVEDSIGQGQTITPGPIPFTPRARKMLELTLREAQQLGHGYLGTEHILLALLREEGGAAHALAAAGADPDRVRDKVLGLLACGHCLADPQTRMVRVNVPADLVAAAEELAQVRQHKQAAFGAGNLEAAAALRDREKQLRAEKLRLEQQLTSGVDVEVLIAENQRAHHELDRLRDLLRQHGIEPDGGAARSA